MLRLLTLDYVSRVQGTWVHGVLGDVSPVQDLCLDDFLMAFLCESDESLITQVGYSHSIRHFTLHTLVWSHVLARMSGTWSQLPQLSSHMSSDITGAKELITHRNHYQKH